MAEIYSKAHTTQLALGSTDPNASELQDSMLAEPWIDLDPTYGLRKFRYAANTGTNTTSIAVGQVVTFYDIYARACSTSFTDGPFGCVLGVGQAVIASGANGWLQTDGYHPALFVDNSTFALGKKIVINHSSAGEGTLAADGTAPPYTPLGTALAASSEPVSQYIVAAQLHVGRWGVGL
jgi:hypothetical protein